jgi:hypothetical protein
MNGNDQWLSCRGVTGRLTMSRRKAELYEQDTYFRESVQEFRYLADSVNRLALLLLKPDAVVSGQLASLLEEVADHGFTPIYVQVVTIDRLMFRSLWWYQHNAVTIDRLAVMSRLVRATPSVLILLRDDRLPPRFNGRHWPASVRLTSLKGQFRQILATSNSMFSLIHTSDEPIDLLRELAILLDEGQRRDIVARLSAVGADRMPDLMGAARALVSGIERQYPPHDFDPLASLQRLRVAGIRADLPFPQLVHAVDDAEFDAKWDLFMVISQSIRSHRAEAVELVEKVPPGDWDRSGTEPESC